MKKIIKYIKNLLTISVVITGICTMDAMAAGLLKPVDRSKSDVYMKSHHVNVTINNGFARTEVDQIFFNKGTRDLSAVYTFPVPKQASLSEVSLFIDGREVIGEVLEKEKARKVHEDQAARGNDTALAEKNDYKTFDISVSPVRAQNETRVRLVYYQPLEIDLNIGRYVYQSEEGGVDEERISFWSIDDIIKESFKFNLELKSAFPIKDIRIPGYQNQAIIQKASADDTETEHGEIYEVSLDFPEGATLSKDIVLYYRLDDNVPARLELIPYKADAASDGTFMVIVTPGASLQRIAEGTDWTFVLDVSGSMSGNKIATLADGVSRVIKNMSPADRFRIVTFNNKAEEFSGGYLQATEENVQHMITKVKAIMAGGGTALYAGLKMGYKGLDEDRITGIILVTDGVANIGPSQHADLLNLHRQYDFRLFTFVIGNSANQPLLETLAKESGGFAMNISTSDDIIGRILQAKAKVLHECLYDAKLKFHGEKVKKLTPEKIGNLYMGQQVIMFGRYEGSGNVKIELTGKIAGREESWTCSALLPDTDTDNPELERLWALSSIEDIMAKIRDRGEKSGLRKKVVDLGTGYSLVTDYTSIIVISETEMENLGIQRNNASRVNRERLALKARAKQPVKSYRVDHKSGSPAGDAGSQSSGGGMFGGARSPGIGSGPVGPFFLVFAAWLRRRKMK